MSSLIPTFAGDSSFFGKNTNDINHLIKQTIYVQLFTQSSITDCFSNGGGVLNASADVAVIDGIAYNLNRENKTAEVFDRYAIGYSAYEGDIVIPSTVVYEEYVYSVTNIRERAFGNCSFLTSITIPESVTRVGGGAFWGCI